LSKRLFLFLLCLPLLTSCGSSKYTPNPIIIGESSTAAHAATKATSIIDTAKSFEGTRYKFGGTDKKGMDCSGLVYTSFKGENIELPRISRDMATQGVNVELKDVIEGDLLFFKTSRKNSINHVGLVTEINDGQVYFIHSTTQRGVIVSSLDETYWKNSFTTARRIL